jgi:hypothetical protein
MIRATQTLPLIGAFVILLLNPGPKPRPDQVGSGGEWLSWTPPERNTYVYGFLDGISKEKIEHAMSLTICSKSESRIVLVAGTILKTVPLHAASHRWMTIRK